MNILKTQVLQGANYWSNEHQQLIGLEIDLGNYSDLKIADIEDLPIRLAALLPLLSTRRYTDLQKNAEDTVVNEICCLVQYIALEIQTLSGMYNHIGTVQVTPEKSIYHILFAYSIEKAGVYAGTAAVNIVRALIDGRAVDNIIAEDIQNLKNIHSKYAFGPSTAAIIAEAIKRNIPYRRLNNQSLVALGYGSNQKQIRASMTCNTSSIGVDIAGDKDDTKAMLKKAYIPVPEGILIVEETELETALKIISFPAVIKPLDGNHGRGITTNILSRQEALEAFKLAKTVSKYIIVEEFIRGFDYRFLVVNYELVAAAKRSPASIIGDGISTIQELIDQTNRDPARGEGHEKVLTKIVIDEITLQILKQNLLDPLSILTVGQILMLKDAANISTGGTSRDVTDLVHPSLKKMVERVARIVNLDICGIDIVASDINVPMTREMGAIVEVNAAPGLRMHLSPAKGLARNVAAPIVDMLFPDNATGRIPIVAVSGTNGKTTTTRLMAHLAKSQGFNVGFTTSDGIYIGEEMIVKGDCTGPASAATILTDPTVDFAVLETARGGILRAGLGFDNCDISIITNITDDHLGLKNIHTMEDLARVKAVVAKSTNKNGFAILNADDDLVYNIKKELKCQIGLFSIHQNNLRISEHIRNGGKAIGIEDGFVVLYDGQWKTKIDKIINIPLSMKGHAECMIKNILPAVLAAVLQGFGLQNIREGLKSFIPSAAQTPGRMNIFEFNNFKIMVDYAHNPDGFLQLKKFMDANNTASIKIGVLSATGDRRDEDIINMGKIAAQTFDEIILKHDEDLRGRTKEEIIQLLMKGIYSIKEIPVNIISDEITSVKFAIDNAPENAFITICADKIEKVIHYIQEAQGNQDPFLDHLTIINKINNTEDFDFPNNEAINMN